MDDPLRLYAPDEVDADGYPAAWHRGAIPTPILLGHRGQNPVMASGIKHVVRELADYRCERCGHPYPPLIADRHPKGEWTPCDERCTHAGPERIYPDAADWSPDMPEPERQAQWRVLTVHHLNGVKWDCRWWNLAALCQRCHLTIQGKVRLERPYDRPHTEWFKPHAAGYYASEGIVLFDRAGSEPTREWVMEHMDAILAVHATQATLL